MFNILKLVTHKILLVRFISISISSRYISNGLLAVTYLDMNHGGLAPVCVIQQMQSITFPCYEISFPRVEI